MAKKPKTVTLGRHDYRVIGERPGWIPPSPEEYAGLFRVLLAVGLAAVIGALRAWWKLHH